MRRETVHPNSASWSTTASRVMFVDFDGLFHPAGATAGSVLPFEYVAVLASLLLNSPDVRVVVHSSWRETFTDDELRGFLGELGSRFSGAVPPGHKGAAIQTFLSANPRYEHHIVLDDSNEEFLPDFDGTLVICESSLGITDPNAQAEIKNWLLRTTGNHAPLQ